ncbi:replication protein A 70 kDa DNA-binding subunit E [Trifolium repens]|nr:replication protein A 70 kDa DNA-binding subunit E [Trifolium repens]
MSSMISVVDEFSKIEEVNSDKATWNCKAKIIRLWEVSDFNRNTIPFSIEMVLMDADGAKIHATVKKTLIYKFKDELKEGKIYAFENMGVATNGGPYRSTQHRYKLNFQFTSIVQRFCNQDIVKSPFNFTPIAEILGGSYDTDFLVDVIGFLTGVGCEREITNQHGVTSKLNVIELEADGHKIQCSLFGAYVDLLNGFLGAGDVQNVVVVLQFAKAKKFQDNIHIQNCMNCTVLLFNPSCEEAVSFKSRQLETFETPTPTTLTQISVESQVQPMDEFFFNTPRSTLRALKEATTEKLFVVLGTVKRILNPDSFWYTACICNKAVIPDSRMFYCEKCNKHVSKVFPRFCIKVRVMDDTDSGTFVIFDRDASVLFNMSCADMIEGPARVAGGLPPQIGGMVDKTWLFKVETKPSFNPRFEQSFRVRKICTDEDIINQFKAKWDKEDATFIKNSNEDGSLSTLLLKGKDTLVDGSTNFLVEEFETGSGSDAKDKGLILEGTPVEVSQDLMTKFSCAALNLGDDSPDVVSTPIEHKVHKGKSAVVNLNEVEVAAVKGKPVVNLDEVEDSVVKGKCTIVNLDNEKSDSEKGKSAAVRLDDGKPAVDKGKKVEVKDVVNLDHDHVAKVKAVSEGKICDGPAKKVKKNVAGKRVSPTPQDEDDNTPIKLLKRAIKIEKIA